MSKTAVALAAIAIVGAGIVAIPVESGEAVAPAPVRQVPGTAPSAAESDTVARLRLAEGRIGDEVVAALRR